MAEHGKKLVYGTIIVISFMVLSALLGYVLKYSLARNFSVKDIGLFYSVLSFVTFFIFFRDFGLSEALVYFIPRFLVEKAAVKIKSTIILTIIVQSLSGLFFLVLFVLFSDFLSIAYFKDGAAKMLLVFLAFYFFLDGIIETLYRSFHGFQNMFLYQGIEFSFQLFSFVFIMLIILKKLSVAFFGLAYLIATIVTLVLFSFLFIKLVFPKFNRTKTKLTKRFAKRIFGYSLPAMSGDLAAQLFGQQSIFFLTLFSGLESVGYYVMAIAVARVAIYLFKATAEVFLPMISAFWRKKDLKKLNFYFGELITLTYVLMLPLSATIMIFSKEILGLLYGDSFVAAAILLKIASVYFLLYCITVLMKRVFLNTGMPKISRNATYIMVISNAIASLLLIPTYGFVGAGIADLISLITSMVYVLYMNKRTVNLTLPVKDLFKLLFSTLVFSIALIILKSMFVAKNIIEIAVICGLSGLIYCVLIVLIGPITLSKIDIIIRTATNNKIGLPNYRQNEKIN